MTYQGSPRNALEALLAASRRDAPLVRPPAPPGPSATAQACPPAPVAVDRAAVGLLARVLAYRPVHGPPIIQLIGCATGERAGAIAASLARTCAVLVGRTLMVEVDPPETSPFMLAAQVEPLPDTFMTRLYHHRIGYTAADADFLFGEAKAQALAALAGPFRILIVDAPEPSHGATLALAPLCSCTVLVVQSGITPLASVRAAAAAVRDAGGRVAGTVLAGVPHKPQSRSERMP